jgi:SAM-dependent methyltransferase
MSEKRPDSWEYEDTLEALKHSYNRAVEERDKKQITAWKSELRGKFLQRLQKEGKTRILEIGAGVGHDSLYFQEQGMNVTSTDLSLENVHRCIEKGLNAYEMDFKNLDFPPSSFEAIYAMNCLLHVPRADFSEILASIHSLLIPSGLFFLGQYGGRNSEGEFPDDHYRPQRFFSMLSDDKILQFAEALFQISHFEVVELESETELHFQCLFLRRAEA